MRARVVLILALLLGTIGCDHVAKRVAVAKLRGTPARSLFDGVVRLHYVENPGAFLSLGAELPAAVRWAVFTLGGGLLLVALGGLVLTRRETGQADTVAVALIVGGGTSNLVDRVLRDGRVVDFVQLAVGPLHTGIFNVADVALTAGALLLLASLLRRPVATS
jgi:signal peptidase II